MERFTSTELRQKLANIQERLDTRSLPFCERNFLNVTKSEIVIELVHREAEVLCD